MSKEVHRIYFCKDGAILDTQIREGEDVTDTLKRCFKKITDLEAKLAESEADKKALICDYESRITKNHELMSWLEHKNEELKQQLFESGLKTLEEIKLSEQRKKMLEDLSTKNWELEHQLAEKEKESLKYFNEYRAWKSKCELLEQDQTKILETNQDKISFAVEALEIAQKYVQQYVNNFDDMNDCLCAIDSQIKAIKEMK